MRSRFKKIWCEYCEFLVYPGQCEHERRAQPAGFQPWSAMLVMAATAEAKKIGRPLRITMYSDLIVIPR
jgi:hypothetical protein